MQAQPIIEVEDLHTYLGGVLVHNGVNLTVRAGEIVGIIGPSGGGKTTLLRSLLMLQRPLSGSIKIFGRELVGCSLQEALSVKRRWGVMFQGGALFSSLNVLENVLFPLREYSALTASSQQDLALFKIALVGLEFEDVYKYPAELSGGMKKRAALARAIVLDPELIFLDEPTTGLDPRSASAMDDLILALRKDLGLTIVMISHDMDSLCRVPDRICFLDAGKVLAVAPMEALIKRPEPEIQNYFMGRRSCVRRQEQVKDGQ